MKLGLTGRTLMVVGVAVLACGTAFGLLTLSVVRLNQASRESNSIDATIAAANELQAAVFRIATGERGYVATGDASFLRTYSLGLRQRKALASRLLSDVQRSPERLTAKLYVGEIDDFVRGSAITTVELAHHDLAAARTVMANGQVEHHLDDVGIQFGIFTRAEQTIALQRRIAVSSSAHRGIEIGLIGLLASILMPFLYVIFLERSAVRPLRALVRAMLRVGEGDLSARADGDGAAEVGALEHGFNWMAESLEHHRDELEAQNVELEAQHIELEGVIAQLANEQTTTLRLSEFSERLIEETEIGSIAQLILGTMADAVDAEIGAFYGLAKETATTFSLEAVRGLDAARLLETDLGESELTLSALGEDVPVRHELHVPLFLGERRLGFATLGRLRSAAFADADRELLSEMAARASIVLGKALVLDYARRVASVNQTLIDSSLDGIRLTDISGQTIVENRRMVDLIQGLVDVPATATHWEQGAALVAATTDPEKFGRVLANLLEETSREAEIELPMRDSGRVLQGFTAPVMGAGDKQIGRIFILRDITDERQLQQMKDEFVATVTHELRTPLTSIVGFAELLLGEEAGELTDDQREFVEIIERSSERLLRLVGDLLFVARVEAGMLELERGEVNLDAVVADSIEAVRPFAEHGQVTVELVAGRVTRLDADAVRLGQLADNLLSNAVKFTPPGGRVEVTTAMRGDRAVFTVSDSGIGISDADKGKLFARFFRASSATAKAIPGTGLGLSITKAIAEAHRGSISVSDRPGGGTTFTVELPLSAVREMAA